MRKLIEDKGELIATTAVAFGICYSLFHCEIHSYIAGFASGAAALVTVAMWLDE